MDKEFESVEKADGKYKFTKASKSDKSRRLFKAFLDVGFARTFTSARVFGALKSAFNRSILNFYSENRFLDYDIESKKLDTDTFRKYIFGGHVAEYIKTFASNNKKRYKSQFLSYI